MAKPNQNVKFELSAARDADRYRLYSKQDILFTLRELVQKRALITMYFNQGNDFLLTSVLAIGKSGKIFLDYGKNEARNLQALGSTKLIFITQIDRIKIQFVSDRLSLDEFERRPAFAITMPESLIRLQRREYHRLTTPIVTPLKCVVFLPTDDIPNKLELNVQDISCGGIALITYAKEIEFRVEEIYRGCRIALPGIGTLECDIEIRNIFLVTMRNGKKCKRSCCRFINIPQGKSAMIQRYISDVEKERISRSS